MTVDLQTWMRAVWQSLVEPSDMARKIVVIDVRRDALWIALTLIAVLNVILDVVSQILSPLPATFEQQMFSLSPFTYASIIEVMLILFVFGTFYAGQLLGGSGTLTATLTIIVWWSSIGLTLELLQLILILISPAVAPAFGLLSLAALIWCFVNFINILHGLNSLGKSTVVGMLALLGTVFCAGVLLAIFVDIPAGTAV